MADFSVVHNSVTELRQSNHKKYQYFYVFAKAGETINIGTSYYGENPDIVVYVPSGGSTVFASKDVESGGTNKRGRIYNYIQEQNGTRTLCTLDEDSCKNYYNPFEVPVTEDGIYRIALYSGAYSQEQGGWRKISDDFTTWNNLIAAYDITVINEAGTAAVPGRVYTYEFFMQHKRTGTGGNAVNLRYYVLTDDGLIYSVTIPEIGGGVYAFMASKRGLVDPRTDESLHYSLFYTDMYGDLNTKANAYRFYGAETNSKDAYYRLFYNVPDQDILNYLGLSEPKTYEVEDFTFSGQSNSAAKVGEGGTFTFTADYGDFEPFGTYTITLDLGSYGTLTHSDAVAAGQNSWVWDGKDINGNVVEPTGNETSMTMTASLSFFNGESHSLLYDVEYNPGGVIVQWLNGPEVGTGNVYYNNTSIKTSSTETLFDQTNHSAYGSGVNSQSGTALSWNNNEGDHAMLDFWMYVRAGAIGPYTITIADTVNFDVTKVWNDDENRDLYRPSSINFTLYCDGTECGDNPYTITAADGWSIEVSAPMSNTYTVVEDGIE